MKRTKIFFHSFGTELKKRQKSILKMIKNVVIFYITCLMFFNFYNYLFSIEYTEEAISYYTKIVSEIWNEGIGNSELKIRNITVNFNGSEKIQVMNEGLEKLPSDKINISFTLENGATISQSGKIFKVVSEEATKPEIKIDFTSGEMVVSTSASANLIVGLISMAVLTYFVLQFIWWLLYNYIIVHIIDFLFNVYKEYKREIRELKRDTESFDNGA